MKILKFKARVYICTEYSKMAPVKYDEIDKGKWEWQIRNVQNISFPKKKDKPVRVTIQGNCRSENTIPVGEYCQLMQYTGEYDTNREDLYEGDFVKVIGHYLEDDKWIDEYIGQIIYTCGSFMVKGIFNDNWTELDDNIYYRIDDNIAEEIRNDLLWKDHAIATMESSMEAIEKNKDYLFKELGIQE